jgi:ABC-type transport system involved in multi-copper enzyme maturation permease subunit
MHKLMQIVRFTVKDQLRYKSLYMLIFACALPLFLARGCFSSDMVINGRALDTTAFRPHMAAILFQLASYGMFLVTALISMKVFTRDGRDGSLVMILARPVARWQYVFGRVGGIWLLCSLLLLLLHLLIFITTWLEGGLLLPALPAASLLVSVNLLLIILLVSLLTQFMPDIMAALFTLGIVGIGFVSETGFRIFQSGLLTGIARQGGGDAAAGPVALWRILYPKISMLQQYASSLITDNAFTAMGPVPPQVNLCCYLVLAAALLLLRFSRSEIS